MQKSELARYREFLTDNLRLTLNFHLTDQNQGIPAPPLQKAPTEEQTPIPLPPSNLCELSPVDLREVIGQRRSHRRFKPQPIALAELSFLLWATQGCSAVLAPGTALRTVPSAGCRHPFETYLAVLDVEELKTGIYRYLPLTHELVLEQPVDADTLRQRLAQGALNQNFVASAPVSFIWSVIPARSEWRYHTAAHRVILMDAGHLCQNLYLAAAGIDCGTCAVAAYHQQKMDRLLAVDGEEEFTIYLAPVGKI